MFCIKVNYNPQEFLRFFPWEARYSVLEGLERRDHISERIQYYGFSIPSEHKWAETVLVIFCFFRAADNLFYMILLAGEGSLSILGQTIATEGAIDEWTHHFLLLHFLIFSSNLVTTGLNFAVGNFYFFFRILSGFSIADVV